MTAVAMAARSIGSAIDRLRMRGDLVIDGRNLLDPAAVEAAGLSYQGIGRNRRTPTSLTV